MSDNVVPLHKLPNVVPTHDSWKVAQLQSDISWKGADILWFWKHQIKTRLQEGNFREVSLILEKSGSKKQQDIVIEFIKDHSIIQSGFTPLLELGIYIWKLQNKNSFTLILSTIVRKLFAYNSEFFEYKKYGITTLYQNLTKIFEVLNYLNQDNLPEEINTYKIWLERKIQEVFESVIQKFLTENSRLLIPFLKHFQRVAPALFWELLHKVFKVAHEFKNDPYIRTLALSMMEVFSWEIASCKERLHPIPDYLEEAYWQKNPIHSPWIIYARAQFEPIAEKVLKFLEEKDFEGFKHYLRHTRLLSEKESLLKAEIEEEVWSSTIGYIETDIRYQELASVWAIIDFCSWLQDEYKHPDSVEIWESLTISLSGMIERTNLKTSIHSQVVNLERYIPQLLHFKSICTWYPSLQHLWNKIDFILSQAFESELLDALDIRSSKNRTDFSLFYSIFSAFAKRGLLPIMKRVFPTILRKIWLVHKNLPSKKEKTQRLYFAIQMEKCMSMYGTTILRICEEDVVVLWLEKMLDPVYWWKQKDILSREGEKVVLMKK